jgi:two-component system chemotaxis response regulator CheB
MPVSSAVVIGASAGGLDAVRTVINVFPKALNAPVFIVVHTSPEGPGLLSSILDRVGPLPARTARHLEVIENGHIYVAPPDRHLVVDDRRIRLTRGPAQAASPSFRTRPRLRCP